MSSDPVEGFQWRAGETVGTARQRISWVERLVPLLIVAPTQAEAYELNAGVSLGWLQAGTVPRLGDESMKTTRSELLDIIYRFYPRGVQKIQRIYVPPGEPVYEDTVEHRRLVEAANRGRAEYPTWKAMVRRLGDRYGIQDESLSLFGDGGEPAYSARIYRRKDLEPVPSPNSRASLSFHVSLLGPYYGIHDTGEPDEIPAAVAEEIEATYPGYEPIPPELGNEVVPDVDMDAVWMGEATIYMCLFSPKWTWVDP